MNKVVAVIGGGGRESVLIEKYSQSLHVSHLIAIPGNDLMQSLTSKPVLTFPNIKTTDKNKILKICLENKVDLVDVSQDDAVARGVVDLLISNKINVVGPRKLAGKIEWSKSYERKLLKKVGVPQPEFYVFNSLEKGIVFLKTQKDQPWFVKADGLASGKGAMAAKNNTEAIEKIKSLKTFGKAGKKFLIEKWIKNDGKIAEEFSAFALSDGKDFKIMGFAQDHKRANDGDKGDNTGGMGASFPPGLVDKNIEEQVKQIFEKTFDALKKKGTPYVGVLFLGGILIGKKVYVIEFNARWGDPEAQVIVPSIQNDFYELGIAVSKSRLKDVSLKLSKKSRISVAIAPFGYPVSKKFVGNEIKGLGKFLGTFLSIRHSGKNSASRIVKGSWTSPSATLRTSSPRWNGVEAGQDDKVKIYGAGITLQNDKYYTTGGRAFHVVASGGNIKEARKKAYSLIGKIISEGNKLHFRTDIGWRDLDRE